MENTKIIFATSKKPTITMDSAVPMDSTGLWRRIFYAKSPEEILEGIIKNNRKKLFMSDFYFKSHNCK